MRIIIKKIVSKVLPPLIVACVFTAALWLLYHELKQYHFHQIMESFRSIALGKLSLAAALTGMSYLVLMRYDVLALRYVGRSMPLSKVVLGSFLGSAVAHSVGNWLGGTSVRYRLYGLWGLSTSEVIKLCIMLDVTFWSGVVVLAGCIFLIDPLPDQGFFLSPLMWRIVGLVLLTVASSYLVLCIRRRRPIGLGIFKLAVPSPSLALAQFGWGVLDEAIVIGVVYVLLPDSLHVSYLHFASIYLIAMVAGIASHVPGGLGIFELSILTLLGASHTPSVAAALLAFRTIYYLAPLGIALCLLGSHEVAVHWHKARGSAKALANSISIIAPRLLAGGVFVCGAILMLSGATPIAPDRAALVHRLVPLPLIELSHFTGSVTGSLLLVLAQSLYRRVDIAYVLTLGLLVAGAVTSLLKGLDYEEALILTCMVAVMAPCRKHFYRKSALLRLSFTWKWAAAMLLVMACCTWLTLFAYRHVEYTSDLWWQFALHADAPRALRGEVAGAALLLFSLGTWLFTPASRLPPMASPEELDVAESIVRQSNRTAANLALLGDKRLLFNESRTAFIMFGIEGRSWVAMGDPIGSEDQIRDLVWAFRELCDQNWAWPVFYEVEPMYLPLYIDAGLTFLKLGEEARVPLQKFQLDGGHHKSLRKNHKHLSDAGCIFEIAPADRVAELLNDLRAVSDEWLSLKQTAEKGFSLGFFDARYLQRYPVAIVRYQGRIVAFANLWQAADGSEISCDLMRHSRAAPDGVMDFLLTKIMLWGKDRGFQWFNLGMAPLSGIEAQPLGPLWNRVAALFYERGEQFYRFQGLRHFKEKFSPVWQPKFLASPGGFELPMILSNLVTLISGGVLRSVRRPARSRPLP